MSNRFTAPEKWVDPWFCELSINDKLFWVYICDNCNHAGIWQVNWPLVKFHIPNYEFNHEVFNGRVEILDEATWFLKKFVLFQQKISSVNDLNPLNKCHLSIINILKSKGLVRGFKAPKKGLGRGQGIGNSNSNSNTGIVKGEFSFEDIYLKYPNKVGKKAAERHFLATVKTDQDFQDIQTALKNYLASERVKKGFIQNASTWYNQWRDWVVPPVKEKAGIEKYIRED